MVYIESPLGFVGHILEYVGSTLGYVESTILYFESTSSLLWVLFHILGLRVLLGILKYVGSSLGYVDTKNACTGRILGSTLHALCLRAVFGKLEVLLGIFIVL